MKQNSNFEITYMCLADLEYIKDILETDFDNFWNYNVFKSELENPNSTYFIVKHNNEIIGFAGALVVLDEADITNIVIKKSFRGKRHFKFTYGKISWFLYRKKYCKIKFRGLLYKYCCYFSIQKMGICASWMQKKIL